MKYFKKINLQNTITDRNGKAVAFTPVFGGNGVLELDEATQADLIADIDAYADARSCGVVRISKEIFDAQLKKKAFLKSRLPSSPDRIRVAGQPEPFSKKPAAQAVGDVKVDLTPELPPSFSEFKTRTRRLNAVESKERQ